jgi:hypothetical protein
VGSSLSEGSYATGRAAFLAPSLGQHPGTGLTRKTVVHASRGLAAAPQVEEAHHVYHRGESYDYPGER